METSAGCATICRDVTKECYGIDCCQILVDSPNNEYDTVNSLLQFYQIDFEGSPLSGPATLIAIDSMNEFIGKLSTSDPPAVPIVLLWKWDLGPLGDAASRNST
ncbi:hypothetical protein V2J09_017731 [Rumex salicifolius]